MTRKLIVATIIGYIVIHSLMCSPMALISQNVLSMVGIESEIGVSEMIPEKSYNHAFIIINDKPYEPRYAGLFLRSNVDYNNPMSTYNSTDEYTDRNKVFNGKSALIAIQEFLT